MAFPVTPPSRQTWNFFSSWSKNSKLFFFLSKTFFAFFSCCQVFLKSQSITQTAVGHEEIIHVHMLQKIFNTWEPEEGSNKTPSLYSWMSAVISSLLQRKLSLSRHLLIPLHQSASVSGWVLKSPGAGAPGSVGVQQTMDRPKPEKETEMSVTMPGSCQLRISK